MRPPVPAWLDLGIAYQRRIWGARNLHLVFLNARLENVSTKRVHCIRFYRLDTIDAAVFIGVDEKITCPALGDRRE